MTVFKTIYMTEKTLPQAFVSGVVMTEIITHVVATTFDFSEGDRIELCRGFPGMKIVGVDADVEGETGDTTYKIGFVAANGSVGTELIGNTDVDNVASMTLAAAAALPALTEEKVIAAAFSADVTGGASKKIHLKLTYAAV